MKKILILLMIVTLMFALASCAQGGNDPEPDNSTCEHKDSEGTWLVTTEAEEATCSKDGHTKSVVCSKCGYVETEAEVIPAKGHVTAVIPAVEATCLKVGSTAGVKCTDCGEILVSAVEIPKKSHSVINTPSMEATCTVSGSEGGTHCSVCLTVIEKPTIIAPFGHDRGLEHIIVTPGYAATCMDTGLTDNIYCTICERDVLTAKVIETTAHLAEDLQVVPGYAETCTATGLTDGEVCTYCGVTTIEQVEIPVNADSHPADMIITLERVEPVCYADGLTEGKHCDNCGIDFIPQEVITERPEHILDTENLIADALAPDCGTHTNGYTAHYACTEAANGCTFEVLPEVVEYKHNHSDWTVSIEAGIGTAGEKYTFCTECGEYIEEQIPALLPDGTTPDDAPDYIDPDGAI